jgi:hypothetical protein
MNYRGWTELGVLFFVEYGIMNVGFTHIYLVIRYNALCPRVMMRCDLAVIVTDTLFMNSCFSFFGQYLAVFEVSIAPAE